MQHNVKSHSWTLHAAFLVDTAPQFTELNRVAGVLKREGWDVTFIFDGAYQGAQRDLHSCRDMGYHVVSPPKNSFFFNTIRSSLSRVKARTLSAISLTLDRHVPNTDAANPATPCVAEKQRHFWVSTPRLVARHGRMRLRRWQQSGSLSTLPSLILNICGTIIFLTPKINKWMWQVWLPYKVWSVKRSMHRQVQRSPFAPVRSFKFLATNIIICWTNYIRDFPRRDLYRTSKAISVLEKKTGLDNYSPSLLTPTAADFEILRIKATISRHQKLLLDRNITLLILAKDCAYYETSFWVEAARRARIATALIPFDDADTKALAQDRVGHRDHQVVSDHAKEIALACPEWVLNWGNECLMLLPPELVEARARLGLTPPNPWAYNSTRCDLVLVESETKKAKLLAENAPPEQVVVTGTVFQDMLAHSVSSSEGRRSELLKQLKLKDDKLLVLGSVTPNKIAERLGKSDFSDYHDMLSYWISQITNDHRFNVILCLHPSVDDTDVGFLEQHGAHIIRQDTASLIPLCDVYIVDCSATSRWALASGKLVLDYDVYRYDLAYHSKLPGIIHVLEKKDFETALKRLADGELDALRQKVATSAKNDLFGRLDGAAAKRLEATCRNLVQAQRC